MGWAARAKYFGREPHNDGARFRAHVVELAMTHEFNVYESDLACRRGKGGALPFTVVVPTVKDAESYAITLHEIGHLQNPCAPSHQQTQIAAPEDYGTTTTVDGRVLPGKWICLTCELAAWRWARANAITWNAMMHRVRAHGLGSYRQWATAAERDEIDRLVKEE
jgi:hypothetical protein